MMKTLKRSQYLELYTMIIGEMKSMFPIDVVNIITPTGGEVDGMNVHFKTGLIAKINLIPETPVVTYRLVKTKKMTETMQKDLANIKSLLTPEYMLFLDAYLKEA